MCRFLQHSTFIKKKCYCCFSCTSLTSCLVFKITFLWFNFGIDLPISLLGLFHSLYLAFASKVKHFLPVRFEQPSVLTPVSLFHFSQSLSMNNQTNKRKLCPLCPTGRTGTSECTHSFQGMPWKCNGK